MVNSFSKSFLMTGWRLGWLVLPAELTPQIGKLIEFNTSCAPVFVQRAATAPALGAAWRRFEAQIVDGRRLYADTGTIALLHMKTKTSSLPLPLL